MAGILDFLNSPDAQLGIGLLAAGGPTTDPNRTGLGQRIAGALQSVTANQAALTDAQLKKAQLADELQKTQVNAFQLKRLQDWQNMVTGGAVSGTSPTGASPSTTAQASGVVPPAMSGAPTGAPGMAQPSASPPSAPGFAYALPGVGDQQSRAIAAILPPADYMKMYADKAGPQSDIAKMLKDAGIDLNSPLGHQLVQSAIAKQNYIPPVSGRPGGYLASADGTIRQLPHVPDGFTAIQGQDGQFHMVPVDGGLAAMQQSAGATALGKAGAVPTVRYQGNTPIFSTQANDVALANGSNPQASGTNPAFQNLPPAQGGMTSSFEGPAEKVIPLIASMKDPQERANAYDAYSRQLTGSGPTQGAPAAAVTPVLTPGAEANADAAQKSSAQSMLASYSKLQAGNSTANAALDALNKMQELGAKKNSLLQSGPLMAGPLETVQTSISTNAAEYDKQRANVITLLANQQGTNGTDAGRALTGQSVPDFGKPKAAIQDGLETLKNQTIAQQLKANLLTPVYQAGDSKAYTKLENEFDQNISPSMVPLLTMPPGKSRAMLLKSAAKDPDMRAKLNWAAENGLLK